MANQNNCKENSDDDEMSIEMKFLVFQMEEQLEFGHYPENSYYPECGNLNEQVPMEIEYLTYKEYKELYKFPKERK